MKYSDIYEGWKSDPEGFWMEAAKAIDWTEPPSVALDSTNAPLFDWFTDWYVNTCNNALDRHVEKGRADQSAIIYDSPITGTKQNISYRDLLAQTAQMAGALSANGISKGDRVIIYMPMIPETIVAMLAFAHIGAIRSVVFGRFAANELAVRIDDASPKAILSASCGIEPGRVIAYKPLMDAAINLATHKPEFVLFHQHEQLSAELREGRHFDWRAFQEGAEPTSCVPVEGNHPTNIYFTHQAQPARPKA